MLPASFMSAFRGGDVVEIRHSLVRMRLHKSVVCALTHAVPSLADRAHAALSHQPISPSGCQWTPSAMRLRPTSMVVSDAIARMCIRSAVATS